MKKILVMLILPIIMMTNMAYAVIIDGVEYWSYDIPTQYKFDECPTLAEVQNMSMYSACGLSLEQLERGLQGELKELAMSYFDAEGMYGVNAVIKAAQDALESDWGRKCFEDNNISGFFTDMKFESKADCIDMTAARLQVWYLLPPEDCECELDSCTFGQYYNGSSIYEVSIKYCPIPGGGINYDYGNKVSQTAYEIYQRAFEVEE